MSELLNNVVELQKLYLEARLTAEEIKGQLDTKRMLLLQEMADQGIKSQEDRNRQFIVSRTETVDVRLVDEVAALDWLENQPNIEADSYIGLKWDRFKPMARMALKKDGEIIPGIQTEIREGLTIRKQGDKKEGEPQNGTV